MSAYDRLPMRHVRRLFLALTLFVLPAAAQARTEYFVMPEIRKDFCGARISAQYCKCAFHGQMCDAAGMQRGAADAKVQAEFGTFVAAQIETFARGCMGKGGIWGVVSRTCEYCEGGKVRSEGGCKDPKDVRPLEERYNLPKVQAEGGSRNVGYVADAEGEFFVYSAGRGKWIGPVRGGLQLYDGDVLHTTENGRARIRLDATNTYVLERTTWHLPGPKRERSWLERGSAYIWESIKRLATNQPLEIDGGAHSVLGIRGTRLLMDVAEDGSTTYALHEGLIDVWRKDDSTSKKELKPGDAARVTASGMESVTYDWDAALRTRNLASVDLADPQEPKKFSPIDPDAINPPEAAYSGDLAGGMPAPSKGAGPWLWLLLLAGAGGGVWYVRAMRRADSKSK